jgi:hypothetical protein
MSEKLVPVAKGHWMTVYGEHGSSTSGRLLAPTALPSEKYLAQRKFSCGLRHICPKIQQKPIHLG